MFCLVDFTVNKNTGKGCEKNSKPNTKECKASLRDSEEIRRALEDVGKGGEEEEKHAKGEGCVEGEEEDDELECVIRIVES